VLPENERKLRSIRILISSSMSTTAHNILRAAIAVLVSSHHPLLTFDLIESGASTGTLDEEMYRLVRDCDVVMMVLHKPALDDAPIRQGVAKEYRLAREQRKPLLLFTEAGYEDDPKGRAFLSAVRGDRGIKTYPFGNAEDLLRSIELSIFTDMLAAYRTKLQSDGQRAGSVEPAHLAESINAPGAPSSFIPSPAAVIKGIRDD
jgi:hypothetical protein